MERGAARVREQTGTVEYALRAGLVLSIFLLPLLARASGNVVGAFSMFEHLERYRLELSVHAAGGWRPVPVRALAPHLSRDAKRMILPAATDTVGADQVRLVSDGLDDIARLLCRLEPDATEASVRLVRAPLGARDAVTQRTERPCNRLP